MLKWKLMITTLPYVIVVVVIKLVIEKILGFEGMLEFGDVGMVMTGGIFLIGFMLAGTMADFKESEKIPGELACTLETIEESFSQAAVSKPDLDQKRLLKSVMDCTNKIHDWLFKKIPQTEMFASIESLTETARELEKTGATPLGVRAINEINSLRRTVTRIGVISRTGFLASGYALLEVLTVAVLLLLMVSKFKSILAEIILVGFVTLIYVYMIRLIKDVDDPFEYSEKGPGGAAEVELFPLEEYRERLAAKVR